MLTRDIMVVDVVSVAPDAPIGDAVALLVEHEVRHLPVVDGAKLVGVISNRDMQRVEGLLASEIGKPERPVPLMDLPVRLLLSEPAVTVSPDLPIDGLIDRFIEDRVGAIVVVGDDEQLLGIVSYIDVLVAARGRF